MNSVGQLPQQPATSLARASAGARWAARLRNGEFWWRVFIWVVLVLGSMVMILPFLWLLSSSFKPEMDIFLFPPKWIPDPWRPQNYVDALTYKPFNIYITNTLIIVTLNLIAILFTSSLCAYGFARIRFPGRNFWFIATLASVMLPPQVTLIPLYIVFYRIEWLDTFLPLTVPAWFGGGAINIFLIRQFFLGIPMEIEDAARIDGASRLQIWWNIFLPLSLPALTTVAIFTFQRTWDDFYGPLIYLSSANNYTLALGMNLFRGTYTEEMNYMMAIAFLMTLPMIVLFFFAQRYYIRGVVLGGVKG